MENILIIGAHYDDAELGAGATAALLTKQGKKVYKLTLTDNATKYDIKDIYVNTESSKKQSSEACKVLGIEEITDFEPVPCNYLKYETELMQKIEKIIFEKNIDTVFIHYNHDINRDHTAAYTLCSTAARHCDNILLFQSNGYSLGNDFCPSIFFDVSSTIKLKKEALNKYGKEHDRFGRLFLNNIERNHIWGYGNHCEYAEGFVPLKFLCK